MMYWIYACRNITLSEKKTTKSYTEIYTNKF